MNRWSTATGLIMNVVTSSKSDAGLFGFSVLGDAERRQRRSQSWRQRRQLGIVDNASELNRSQGNSFHESRALVNESERGFQKKKKRKMKRHSRRLGEEEEGNTWT